MSIYLAAYKQAAHDIRDMWIGYKCKTTGKVNLRPYESPAFPNYPFIIQKCSLVNKLTVHQSRNNKPRFLKFCVLLAV